MGLFCERAKYTASILRSDGEERKGAFAIGNYFAASFPSHRETTPGSFRSSEGIVACPKACNDQKIGWRESAETRDESRGNSDRD